MVLSQTRAMFWATEPIYTWLTQAYQKADSLKIAIFRGQNALSEEFYIGGEMCDLPGPLNPPS